MSVSQSAEMTSPEGLHGELIQMALTFGIFTQESTSVTSSTLTTVAPASWGTDFVSRVGDSRLDDHIAFAKVQQAGHQRHGLLGTHGGYGGALMDFRSTPRSSRNHVSIAALRSAGAGGDRVSMGVGGVWRRQPAPAGHCSAPGPQASLRTGRSCHPARFWRWL